MTNGYVTIDLKGKALNGTATTIAGVYDAIEASTKPLLITGLVNKLSGTAVEVKPTMADSVTVVSSNYVVRVGDIDITITSGDAVTIATHAFYTPTT